MKTMKLVVATLKVQPVPDNATIKVGTIVVIPDVEGYKLSVPDHTIVLAGQALERELYPELSPLYTNRGGFHFFEVEDLQRKFLIGWDGEYPILGTGCIFYKTISNLKSQ